MTYTSDVSNMRDKWKLRDNDAVCQSDAESVQKRAFAAAEVKVLFGIAQSKLEKWKRMESGEENLLLDTVDSNDVHGQLDQSTYRKQCQETVQRLREEEDRIKIKLEARTSAREMAVSELKYKDLVLMSEEQLRQAIARMINYLKILDRQITGLKTRHKQKAAEIEFLKDRIQNSEQRNGEPEPVKLPPAKIQVVTPADLGMKTATFAATFAKFQNNT